MTVLDTIFKQLIKLTGQPLSGDEQKLKENLENNNFFNQGEERLQRYYPEGAWEEQEIRDWVEGKSEPDVDKIVKLLHEKVTTLYNKRAETLKNTHPLGLQVNLSTGVANGVLVVRSIQDCAGLLHSILLNKMEFDIEEIDNKFIILRERISNCIYRVASGDDFLINAFWNFYLKT